jgi:tetratricopeptide (TPR) repeat protein
MKGAWNTMISRTGLKSDAIALGSNLDTCVEEARRLLDISTHFRDNGWPVKAKRFAARSLAIVERDSPAVPGDVVRALLCLAGARADLADYARAEADYCRVNDILDVTGDSCDCEVQELRIQAFRGLAYVMRAQGRDRRAEALLKQALTIAERTFGGKHADVASALNDLGVHYGHIGAFEKAARLHHQALAIAEKTLGPDHAQTATILHWLAVLEYARRRFAVGEAFARRSADIRMKTCSPDHPQVAGEFGMIAALLSGQGRHEEAESLHRRALVMIERWFGADRREFARAADHLARIATSTPGGCNVTTLLESVAS